MAESYFRTCKGYFWSWDEQESVFAIPEGFTIAYGKQIEELLAAFKQRGFPAFGAILLCLIATDPLHAEGKLKQVSALLRASIANLPPGERGYIDAYNMALPYLERIRELPIDFNQPALRLRFIVRLLEEDGQKHNARSSRQLYDSYQFETGALVSTDEDFSPALYHKDVSCIQRAAARFPSAKALTDILGEIPDVKESLPVMAEIEATNPAPSPDVLEELSNDPQTFFSASLVRHIWSGLGRPFEFEVLSDQAMGGVADISNRGSFDKLLISEFAYSDEVLLSRLANSEALYYQREVPPESNSVERAVMIDTSLHMWGTPKTLAHAVALAFAHHPAQASMMDVYALGDEVKTLSYASVSQVIEGLSILTTQLNAVAGMEAFLQTLDNTKKQELLLVTTSRCLEDPAVQYVLGERHQQIKWLVTVERDGCIELMKNTRTGQRSITQIRLALEELWKDPPMYSADSAREMDGLLDPEEGLEFVPLAFPCPNIFHVMPLVRKPGQYTGHKTGPVVTRIDNLIITNRLHIFRWTGHPEFGNRFQFMGYIALNGAGQFALARNNSDQQVLLSFSPSVKKVLVQNLASGQSVSTDFSHWTQRTKTFFSIEDRFYCRCVGESHQYEFVHDDEVLTVNKVSGAIDPEVKKGSSHRSHHRKPANRASTLRNFKRVAVTEQGNLLLNNHVLKPDDYGQLKLLSHVPEKEQVVEVALFEKDGVFVFKSGHIVLASKNGMVRLVFPEVGDQGYYLLSLEKANTGALASVKMLKQTLNISLSEAKYILDVTKLPIAVTASGTQADEWASKLEEVGVKVRTQFQQGNYPEIFFSTAINKALGLATSAWFSGHTQFAHPEYFNTQKELPILTAYRLTVGEFTSQIMGK